MKSILLVFVCLISVQFAYSQTEKDIVVKNGYVLINYECGSYPQNVHNFKKPTKVKKVLIKKEIILSVLIEETNVIISTSEILAYNGVNSSKFYTIECQTSFEAESFFNKLMNKLYDM